MMSKKQQTNATNEANLSAYMEEKGIAPEDRDVLPFGDEPKAGTPYDLSVFLSVMGSRLSTDEDHDFHRRAVEGFRCLNNKQVDTTTLTLIGSQDHVNVYRRNNVVGGHEYLTDDNSIPVVILDTAITSPGLLQIAIDDAFKTGWVDPALPEKTEREQSLRVLKNFASWRKGAVTKMPNPGDIGAALRDAIEALESVNKDSLLLAKARDIIDWFADLDNGPALPKYEKDHAALMSKVAKFETYFEDDVEPDNWISVDDQLPKNSDEEVLAVVGDNVMLLIYANPDVPSIAWQDVSSGMYYAAKDVIDWQPRPNPRAK